MAKKKEKPGQKLNIRVFALLFVLIAFCSVTMGTMAWYSFQKEMRAISAVRYPNAFFLKGPKGNGSEPLYVPRIDMSKGNEEQFFFTVIGKGDYKIQLGYTTNVPYQYELYRLDPKQSGSANFTCKYMTDTLYFDRSQEWPGNLLGAPLNAATSAKTATEGSTKHGGTYRTYEEGDQVQINAEPIYRQTGYLVNKSEDEEVGYYVLVINWEDIADSERALYMASEETDMICLVAGIPGSEANN